MAEELAARVMGHPGEPERIEKLELVQLGTLERPHDRLPADAPARAGLRVDEPLIDEPLIDGRQREHPIAEPPIEDPGRSDVVATADLGLLQRRRGSSR